MEQLAEQDSSEGRLISHGGDLHSLSRGPGGVDAPFRARLMSWGQSIDDVSHFGSYREALTQLSEVVVDVLVLLLLLLGLLLFLLAAAGVGHPRVNLLALGLACWIATAVLAHPLVTG